MAANITITVSPSTTTPTDFGNSGANGASSANQPVNLTLDAGSLAALLKPPAGGNGGVNGLGGAGQGLHNVKLSSDKGTVQVQMDSQGNLYDKSGKSIGKQNADGSFTFDSGKSPEAEILNTGSANGKHQPQGRETMDASDVSVSAGDLRGPNGNGSSSPDAGSTIPVNYPQNNGGVNANGGNGVPGGQNANFGVGNSPTGGQTITITLGDGSSPNGSVPQSGNSPYANGGLPVGLGGSGQAGQGLHNVKLSTDKGTVQVQMDDQGNIYDKSGKSIGKQNADGSLTFDSGKSTAAEILNTGSTNGKHQPQGRETIDASDVSVSAGDLRGSQGEAQDAATGKEVEKLSQLGLGPVDPQGQTVTV
ncbi:hypothetical protein BLA39750_03296 [Burkholderia lata]|uniref:Uncharacterized protein n=1 Tax=Burkholderia lata (strain ATCC 17760 / DSM 23089 / LMG 22485 / NCIMB 9086 / R18194 / 383) TaxID=482957 RepID=A0A6P2XX38_BURL3|nr:hypothetical protein [Burkholderia lata]VWD12059.1 hypothetical protein BLA39750_03296 [Burkholderia lata]